MNILFISPNSPFDSIGGVERHIVNLINYCKLKPDFKTAILLPTAGENLIKNEGNVTIFLDNCMSLSKNAVGAQKELSVKANNFYEKVKKIISDYNIKIICVENFHIGMPASFNILLNMISETYKIPLILRIHSFATKELQIELINQLMWKKISCVSKSVAGDCFHKGTNIDLLSTDYLGVDKEFHNQNDSGSDLRKNLNLSAKSKIVLTATRIILGKKNILKQKGVINLIQAFSKLSPRFPDLHLIIAVGKPPDSLMEEFRLSYEMLQGYLKLNGIEKKTIIKMFTLEEMGDVYRQSNVFALASENETFGQVFIEAMACGLPVIGTKVGGIPEIISDSYNGFLVPPDDSSILAQRIEKILTDTSMRNRFIKAGLKTIEDKFTANKQFADFIDMLKSTFQTKTQEENPSFAIDQTYAQQEVKIVSGLSSLIANNTPNTIKIESPTSQPR